MTVGPGQDEMQAGRREQTPARERLVQTAYELFCRHGFQRVGIEAILAEAGVAKATLYRHFRSKDELVVACLERHRTLWFWGAVVRGVERRAPGRERLLGIFDVFDEWFHSNDYAGCLFAATLVESHDRTSTTGAASVSGLADVRDFLCRLAEETGAPDAEDLARRWQILMLGSIMSAVAGDLDAAMRARRVGEAVLADELG